MRRDRACLPAAGALVRRELRAALAARRMAGLLPWALAFAALPAGLAARVTGPAGPARQAIETLLLEGLLARGGFALVLLAAGGALLEALAIERADGALEAQLATGIGAARLWLCRTFAAALPAVLLAWVFAVLGWVVFALARGFVPDVRWPVIASAVAAGPLAAVTVLACASGLQLRYGAARLVHLAVFALGAWSAAAGPTAAPLAAYATIGGAAGLACAALARHLTPERLLRP